MAERPSNPAHLAGPASAPEPHARRFRKSCAHALAQRSSPLLTVRPNDRGPIRARPFRLRSAPSPCGRSIRLGASPRRFVRSSGFRPSDCRGLHSAPHKSHRLPLPPHAAASPPRRASPRRRPSETVAAWSVPPTLRSCAATAQILRREWRLLPSFPPFAFAPRIQAVQKAGCHDEQSSNCIK